ncbi:MAG: alkylmercury lyase family protein, partial [Chloroflexota bacterium]
KEYWGNCAWCSLGVAALLKQDCTITTVLGADRQQVEIHVKEGELVEKEYVVHFPIPMTQAWDNVTYTCSTMLLFENAEDVARWSKQHRIAQGDVQPIDTIWQFSKVWYGNHLNPQWEKWTNAQAADIFQQFGLTHPIWHIPQSDTRF